MTGTRTVFRSWLQNKHQLTYTAYSKLDTDVKKKIYDEYSKFRGGKK